MSRTLILASLILVFCVDSAPEARAACDPPAPKGHWYSGGPDARAPGPVEKRALDAGQRAYSEGLAKLEKSNQFSDNEKANFPRKFDPMRLRASELDYQTWKAEHQRRDWRDDCDLLRNVPSTVGLSDREEANCGAWGYDQSGRGRVYGQATYNKCIRDLSKDDATCKSYGLRFGTNDYAQCRQNFANQREANKRALMSRPAPGDN